MQAHIAASPLPDPRNAACDLPTFARMCCGVLDVPAGGGAAGLLQGLHALFALYLVGRLAGLAGRLGIGATRYQGMGPTICLSRPTLVPPGAARRSLAPCAHPSPSPPHPRQEFKSNPAFQHCGAFAGAAAGGTGGGGGSTA